MLNERVFVGLGANLGGDLVALRQTVADALAALAAMPHTERLATSSHWLSAPVQAAGPDYVNAVAELRTSLAPLELLSALQMIEARFGRVRPYANAPRTLDLDLLLYGQRCINVPSLTVPHPLLHQRAFVLEPLAELAPSLLHPVLGELQRWRDAACAQRLRRLP